MLWLAWRIAISEPAADDAAEKRRPMGFLGAIDLWGKREQRASAEAIDTIDQDHWLVARIQGRPRLEKPPLPRWTIAALMRLTGRRDEWMVRLPSALDNRPLTFEEFENRVNQAIYVSATPGPYELTKSGRARNAS